MDSLALIGFLLGLIAVLVGQLLEGGQLGALMNGPALLIVIGGTLGATLLQTPLKTFLHAFKMLRWVIRPPVLPFADGLRRLVNWSATARKEGLLGLEQLVDREDDIFARKGLAMLVDGGEPESIRGAMLTDLELQEQRQLQSARVFEAMGGYCPTLGIVGAVMGLIQVMGNLSDPSRLGSGIAVAFVATVYGVGFANLLFLPVANKLRALVLAQSQYREMLIEGIVAIAEGENPRVIENKLAGFVNPP
ncbi:flagellar motor protein [Permianibacter sp. IMCC34836]|uniref:flagellar motor protein n=1 Tax=Permianibacter fluminis TaxID=2738515 RepID=UPI001557161B|nr:flagellar motor protein [Permianibacter fluminis]NQD38014.1 flagellar motor protein [Permianibacter fluminis]